MSELPKESSVADVKAVLAVRLANWILRTFAPEYAKFVGGSIEYGMRAAAVDSKQGNPNPPDWRTA